MIVEVTIGKVKTTIGGTADLIIPPELWDYKTVTMGKLRMMAKGTIDAIEDYEKQLNSYRWMLHILDGTEIERLVVRAIVRDWRFYEFRRANYKKNQYPRGAIIEVPMWTLEQTGKWLKQRVKAHTAAAKLPDDRLTEAGECDTWRGLRCEHYCALSDICEFYRNRNKEETKQEEVKKPAKKTARKATPRKATKQVRPKKVATPKRKPAKKKAIARKKTT
jgi:hypothetical protein